jgi:hypothetical protein
MLACIMVALAGCNTQVRVGDHKAAIGDQFEELRKNGIHVLSSWEADGVPHIVVFGADQRAVHKVRQVMGEEVVVWNEEKNFFIRGTITEIQLETVFIPEDNPSLLIAKSMLEEAGIRYYAKNEGLQDLARKTLEEDTHGTSVQQKHIFPAPFSELSPWK